jgi:putative membrane protein
MKSRIYVAACIVGAACLLACADNRATGTHEDPAARGARDGHAVETQAAAPRLSDDEIAAVTRAANTGEVAQANAALPKLTHPDAKQFAAMMVKMHTVAEKRQTILARAKGLMPQTNRVSAQLTRESDAIVEQLGAATPDAVDRLYMAKQVSAHQRVLEAIDDVLIPSASDPALKQELQASRAEVALHLERARDAASKLD